MITFMRHAETDWNCAPKRFQGRIDVGISKKGLEEAKLFGKQLTPPSHIISSPALRCRETLAALFPEQELNISFDERLWEMDMGIFAGLSVDEVKNQYPQEWKLWSENPDKVDFGGGTLEKLLTDAKSALKDIVNIAVIKDNDKNNNILVMTHGGVIRVLKCFAEMRPLKHFHTMEVGNLASFLYMQNKTSTGFCLSKI
jgi:broad specificity phosphatase PhoE